MKIGIEEIKKIVNSDVIQSNVEEYLSRRHSCDEGEWSEEYKWDILPRVSQEFFSSKIDKENIVSKIQILKDYNPSSGAFVHWSNLDDLQIIAEKNPQNVASLLMKLFEGKDNVSEAIDKFRIEARKIKSDANLGTPLFGYLFSVIDPGKYSIYKDSTFMAVKDLIDKRKEWSSMSIGEKYQTFNDLCNEMGRNLRPGLKEITVKNILINQGITALDGQDFFYVGIEDAYEDDDILFDDLTRFLQQARTNDLTYSEYNNEYSQCVVKVGFGQGTPAHVPWMGFYDDRADHFSVNFLFYKKKDLLILSYGVGEDHPPEDGIGWKFDEMPQTIESYFQENYNEEPARYGSSLVYKTYDVKDVEKLEKDTMLEDLDFAIKQFKDQLENSGDIHSWLMSAGHNNDEWQNFVENDIIAIGWDDLGELTQYKNKNKIKKELGRKFPDRGANQTNNALACYQFTFEMKKGDQVFVKDGLHEFVGYGVIESDYEFDNDRKNYKHIRKVKWIKRGRWEYKKNDIKQFTLKTLTNITKYPDYVKNILDLINNNAAKNTMTKISKNTILYGPPGTGKTYQTVNKALEIIDGSTDGDRNALKEHFAQYQDDGQIEFVTFHQSYGYEEFVEGIKAGTTDADTIAYNLEDGVFKKISTEALFDCLEFKSFEEDLNFAELYDILVEKITKEGTAQLRSKDDKIIEIREVSKRDTLHCYHGESDVRHSVGKERLKKLYDQYNILNDLNELSGFHKKFTEIIGGANQTVYWTVLHKILEYKEEMSKENDSPIAEREVVEYGKKKELIMALKEKKFRDASKNYVLVIDEINRGNISKIFGELITLIEESKRTGESDETIVRLPYSGEQFTVPSNLYIVGTMNTADRSIALLDTALRRRFDFEEMMPVYDIISDDVEGIDVRQFLQKMNERIEMIFDRDHVIGHAYFLNVDSKDKLDHVMRNKIIPLLQEYFYDDWDKIQKVLGDYEGQNKILGDDSEIEDEDRFITSTAYDTSVLGFDDEEVDESEKRYEINDDFTVQAYMKLYGGK